MTRAIVLLVCWSAAAQALAAEPARVQASVDSLSAEIEKALAENGIPGAGVALVSRDGVLWVGGFGRADVATGRPVTAETRFRVGSISKSFVALALLKLQDERRIDLSASLADVIPEIPISNPYEAAAPVLVMHLLEHTAGFDDAHYSELVASRPAGAPLRDLLLARPRSRDVRWEPGTRASYSSPGYAVAGYVIEKLTGKPFEDYVQAAVLDPIGMTASTFRQAEASQSELATGYADRRLTPAPRFEVYLRPAGAMISSPRDMGLFVRFLLNRGRVGDRQVLSEKALADMETVHTTLAARAGLTNGYGLGNEVDLQFPLKSRGHDGGIPGFSAHYRYLDDHGLGYALLFNTTASYPGRQRTHRLVFDFVTRNVARPGAPPGGPSGVRLEDLAGYYAPANPKDQILAFRDALVGGVHVRVRDERLFMQGFRQPEEELLLVSGTLFRKKEEPEASIVFTRDGRGRVVLVADTGWSYFEKTGPWRVYLHRGFVLGALALMVSSVPFALVWMPLVAFRATARRHVRARVVSLLAALSILLWIVLFSSRRAPELGIANPMTVALFALTLLFAALSAYGLLLSAHGWSLAGRGARVHALGLSLANCGMTAYLAWWGLLGLRTWAW